MPERTVKLPNPSGLHARPAHTFTDAASKHGCDVRVRKDQREVNAKSVLSVLTLDVRQGDEVAIVTDGDGADAALDGLVALIEGGLGEEG